MSLSFLLACLRMATSVTAEKADQIIDDIALEQELAELATEEIPSYIREARLDALKQQSLQFHHLKELAFGTYTLIPDEKSFLDLTTNSEVQNCVVHFFHPDFRRCDIVDTHLEKLSRKYFETKFAKLNVEKSNFLVTKLKIKTLPAVFCFKKSIVVDKIIGFEELGNTDDFPLIFLERRLARAGVIRLSADEDPSRKTILGNNKSSIRQNNDDDDSSDDD